MYQTKLASIQIVLWKILKAYNQDAEATFQAVGLDPALMYNEGARYPLLKIAALWQEMARRIDDPCFGLTTAVHWHPSNFGALGYGLLTSTSLRMTLRRLIRFHRVISDARFGELLEDGDRLVFRFCHVDEPVYCQPREDGAIAWLLSVLRVNYHRDFAPVEVNLIHKEPSCSGKYYEFFRCPVNFAADHCSIVLPIALVDEPLPGGNEQFSGIHDRLSSQYLVSLDDNEIISKTKKAIVELLPSAEANLQSVASLLKLGPRSLQRQLQAEGITFLGLLDETRKQIAREYLRDDSMDLAEIAFLLGFAEQSTFSRSFKRWMGTSPGKYRISANIDSATL
ncbi:AraC family transcriptional regulator [Desulfosediminicola flagellatus]|uniref:AraC family transcriptional regulator n=1 Tax=Desulfosediminicola flagellatus TaxID=2569541 RepID=UPI0010AC3B26|nr:AraC family transcriptional regulator [Desulfosediminicola flagellatus]